MLLDPFRPLPAAVKRGVEIVDVYKTPARIIFSRFLRGESATIQRPALIAARTP